MEKLDLQTFRELKQELVDVLEEGVVIGRISRERLARYDRAIDTLSQYDLSDIDFEEWRGVTISVQENVPIDFSKTKANLDFSIIDYQSWGTLPNFKSCKIKNFSFDIYEYSPDMFDEEFIKENEERFLSEDIPEVIKDAFYNHSIYVDIPTGPMTDEQRREEIGLIITEYISQYGYEQIQGWDEIKKLLNFIPIEYLPAPQETKELIIKYGIDKLIESGIDRKYLFEEEIITNLEEIARIEGIELEDIQKLMDITSGKILENYDAKQLLEYGIKDLSELTEPTFNLYEIKEKLEKIPKDLINIGTFRDEKLAFIEKYGIDNIITLDEETEGMFTYPIFYLDDIYLMTFILAERDAPKLDTDKKLTYEEFRSRMYERLLHSRDEGAGLTKGNWPDYDFIRGKFREEHPDIFIDGNLPEQVKEEFYKRQMKAETVWQNPELIQLLQGKDLSRAFPKKMTVEINMQTIDTRKYYQRNSKYCKYGPISFRKIRTRGIFKNMC